MIYLDNNTQQQECWIPRQDILSGHSGGGGGGSYQEGYNDGVAHQKSLLATTAFTQNGEYTRLNGWSGVSVNVPQTGSTARLEEKTVVISADTTNVHPSSGFDGMSAVTIDAEAYAQQNYDSGFDDGFDDGYSSGSSEGYESGYTSGQTDGYNSGYTEGYDSGSTDGFNSGYTSGETHQKSLLASTALTINGDYTNVNGWSAVTVVVSGSTPALESQNYSLYNFDPILGAVISPSSGYDGLSQVTITDDGYSQQKYIEGYQDGQASMAGEYQRGYDDGEDAIISTFTATTATTNGVYGSSAQPLSSITVSVPTGQTYNVEENKPFTATSNGNYTINPSYIWQITYDDHIARRYYFTINGTIPQSEVGKRAFVVTYYDENTGEEPSVGILIDSANTLTINKNNWDEDDYGNVSFVLSQGKYILEFNNGLDSSEFTIMPYYDGEQYDVMSAVTLSVNVPTGSSATLGEGSFSANGSYSASTDNLDGYSAITVNVDTTAAYNSGYTDGYASGNTDGFNYGYEIGENAVISTFTAATATTNGVYGSSANPLSSITVDVPQTSKAVKYIEYIETDGSEIIWDTGVNIQSSDVKIYLDFMWLTGSTAEYTPFISQVYNDDYFSYYFSVDGNPLWSSQALQRFGSDATVVPMNKDVKYFSVASNTGITLNGTAYANTFTSFDQTNEHMYLNARIYYGNIWRANSARYYRFAVETSGGTMLADLRPCLDENGIPCFYDEVSQTFIYHSGSGTPISGPVIPTEDYVSGHTQGMKDALEDSFYGAYYPFDSATNGSYYTVFPTLEDGQKLYFDIVVYTFQNASLLGNNQGNLFLSMKTSDGVDLRVADSNGLSGATLHSYWLEYYRPNQNPYSRNISRVCGEVSVTSVECKTALDTGGAWLEEIATSGDFSLQYPVTFNTSCASGLVLNSLVYKDVQTNETIHHYKLNPDTLEMEDYFNDNTVAPTYDRNGNLVSGVLEPRQFRF